MKVPFEDGGSGGGESAPAAPVARPIGPALARGFRGRCPACGLGSIFVGYLEVAPACTVCGQPFHHHRADDLPPYLTILIVGHVVVAGLLITEKTWHPEIWLQMAIWLPVTAGLALALLRPLKGAVVALQWALRMHGFGRADPPPHLDDKGIA